MDVLQYPDGSLLVSDDTAGEVYRISYRSTVPSSAAASSPPPAAASPLPARSPAAVPSPAKPLWVVCLCAALLLWSLGAQ